MVKNSTGPVTCYGLRDKRTGGFVRHGGHPLTMNEMPSAKRAAHSDYCNAAYPTWPGGMATKEEREAYSAAYMAVRSVPNDDPRIDPFRIYETVKITLPTIVDGVTLVEYKEEIIDC